MWGRMGRVGGKGIRVGGAGPERSTGWFRDEPPWSVDVFLTRCVAPGWADRRHGCRMGSGMVTDRAFRPSEVRGASWVTLGPQFAMKGRSDRVKGQRMKRARHDFL